MFTRSLLLAKGYYLAVLIIFFPTSGISYGEGLMTSTVREETNILPYPPYRFMTLGAIRMYQRLIAPSKGTQCPMHPHCSLYAQMAFSKYHPINAFIITADRLHRCGHDLVNYDYIAVNESFRWYDPVSSSVGDFSPQDELSHTPSINFIITQEFDKESEDSYIFRFAEELLGRQEFKQALIEYERVLSYFPNSPFNILAAKRIFQCYYQAQEYLNVIHWGQQMIKKGLLLDNEMEIKLYMGISYFKLRNFLKAREQFQDISDNTKGLLRDKALLFTGLCFVHEGKWEDAQKTFACLLSNSEYYEKATELLKLASQGPLLKQKNPVTAGVLAIIPGMGYLYDGYKQTALSSFIVNTLFFWGTAKAEDKGLKATMGILSFGWYIGNIYGSVMSAYRKNERIKGNFFKQFNDRFDF